MNQTHRTDVVQDMEIAGLPLHPLVVHAAVVFGPLAAVSALAYVGLPKHRDRLRWVAVVLVLIGTASIWAAYLTGVNFRASKDFFTQGAIGHRVDTHARYARVLRWVTTGFALVTVVQARLHDRVGAVRIFLGVLVAVAAVGTLVLVILTGDAGARAVWGK